MSVNTYILMVIIGCALVTMIPASFPFSCSEYHFAGARAQVAILCAGVYIDSTCRKGLYDSVK